MTALDPKAIRLVTKRYRELQGLRVALAGAAFAICFGVHAISGATGGLTGLVVVMGVAVSIMAPGMWFFDRYYAQRFGRVVQPEGSDWTFWRVMVVSVYSSVANNWLGVGPVAIVFTIAAPLALWIAIRDWPWRGYYVFATIATAAALLFACTAAPDIRPLADSLAFVLFGGSYVVVGLLDHRLLTSVMRSANGEAGLTTSAEATAVKKSCATGERE